ncbi:ClpP/crotonase-like domain-containing protein, partial [Kalaharituber pfeilii]
MLLPGTAPTFRFLRSAAFLRPFSRLYSVSVPAADRKPPPLIPLTIPAPHTGHITILLLHSPATRNALSISLTTLVSTHLTTLLSSPPSTARALIVASSNPSTSFCAGADLKERSTFTPSQTAQFLSLLRRTLSTLSSLPLPTISSISGPALGGGLELALATDLRVLGRHGALIGLPETRLGIIPGAGGTYRIPSVIGVTRALDLILTGRRIRADEALSIGLATRVVDEQSAKLAPAYPDMDLVPLEKGLEEHGLDPSVVIDPVLRGALELAWEISLGGPIAIRAAKSAVKGWEEGEERENRMYEEVVGTKDRDEALKAFKEKRKPLFKG